MAKKFLLLLPFISAMTTALSQEITRKDADSMHMALNNTKLGIDRIDLLLNLAQFHIFKSGESEIDFDCARVYIIEAKSLNRKANFPAADGYILLTESYMTKEKGNKEEGKKMAERAVAILEPGNNKTYLARAYYELSMYFNYDDPQQYVQKATLVEKAITAFEQTNLLKEKGRALEMLGDLYSGTEHNAKGISVLMRALAIYDSIKYPNIQGVCILLAASYQEQKEYGRALFYGLKALKTVQALKDTSMQLCQIHNHLGRLYQDIGRYDIALKHWDNALETALKYNDEPAVLIIVSNMSATYYEVNQSDRALKVLALVPKSQLNSDNSYTKYMMNMCYLRAYNQLKQYRNAQVYHDIVLKIIDQKLVPEQRRCNAYRYIADYFTGLKQYAKARYYLKKSIDIAEEIDLEYARIQGLRLTYQLDSLQGDFRSAYKHLAMYKSKTDSITSEKTSRQFQVLGIEYEIGLKEDSIMLKDKDIALLIERNNLQQANLRQASLIKNVTITGIVLAFIIIGLLFRQYRHKQKGNHVITNKNMQLQHLLSEKEWLLKEIHHRVKNNLQIVMSLLNSQSAYINNDAALTAIHDSQHRVHAMSLIHQKLYSSENVSSINMSVYIRELVSYLSESFDAGKRIRFELNIGELEMDVSQAVPLGLILNEAITNSIKYAFPDNRSGFVSISLSNTTSNHYLLTISDNGIGMPADFSKTGSLGLSLMKGLSEDLEGIFSIENNNGTTIKVSFIHDMAVKKHNLLAGSFISNN